MTVTIKYFSQKQKTKHFYLRPWMEQFMKVDKCILIDIQISLILGYIIWRKNTLVEMLLNH